MNIGTTKVTTTIGICIRSRVNQQLRQLKRRRLAYIILP